MKATYQWIKEYVPDFAGSVEEMCERFTMSGSEVEYFEPCGDGDWMIELAITSNRVDCLGVVGLARELAAVCGLPLVHPDHAVEEGDGAVEDVCSVAIEDTEGCSRFTAQVIEGVKVGPSPDWLASRISAIGLRPVNNIVDVTNYVMFEMNQPFHAFDLDGLEQGRIIVRRGRPGEKLVAINDKEYELTPEMTLITDPSGPIAIAGVMGGLPTEVGEGTSRILLETAAFEKLRIRATSRDLGLASDASFRFERGVDDQGTLVAARRCARMIVEVAGGRLRRGIVDVDGTRPRVRPIPFRHAEVARITGIEIPWDRCREIFEGLTLEVRGDPASGVEVTPPSWRSDLEREVDLVEEVIRVHGLEHLPVETGMRVMTVKDRLDRRVKRIVKEGFVAAGFSETLTTSFLAESEGRVCLFADTEPVVIANAMRQDESSLRQSLLPSLLHVRKVNQDHGNDDVRVMECTVVYLKREAGRLPEHLPIVGALLDGNYREARGVVDRVAAALGVRGLTYHPLDERPARFLDQGGGATVRLGEQVVGHVGRPAGATIEAYDLKVAPVYLELRLDGLTGAADLVPRYEPLSRFPAVKRDLAIVLDEHHAWGDVESCVRSLGLPDLESLEFFDEYRGKQVGGGKKSLAFSLTYRSHERTLTGEEVDASQKRAIEALEGKLGARIRA